MKKRMKESNRTEHQQHYKYLQLISLFQLLIPLKTVLHTITFTQK